MGTASFDIVAAAPGPAESRTTSDVSKTTLLVINLIPMLLIVFYVLGLLCWFRHHVALCCCYPLAPRRWRSSRKGVEDKRRSHKGGYVNVNSDEDGIVEETVPLSSLSLSPPSSWHRAQSQRDEESVVELREFNAATSPPKKREKKRPRQLVLRTDYTPLPSFAEEDEAEAAYEGSSSFHMHNPPHTAMLCSSSSENREHQVYHRSDDHLNLSKYFDLSTGRLHKHILLEPETELSQLRMKEERGMVEYTGGLGDNIISRWFDRVVHWTTIRAHAWLEPESMRIARGTEDRR